MNFTSMQNGYFYSTNEIDRLEFIQSAQRNQSVICLGSMWFRSNQMLHGVVIVVPTVTACYIENCLFKFIHSYA